jgi:hypothetical protein
MDVDVNVTAAGHIYLGIPQPRNRRQVPNDKGISKRSLVTTHRRYGAINNKLANRYNTCARLCW